MLSSTCYGMWWWKQSIFAAAYKGNVERVQELLNSGIDVNVQGSAIVLNPEATPLYWATAGNQACVAQFLIERGADINRGSRYDTPLHAAAERGFVKMVQLLLRSGADVNARAGHFSFAYRCSVIEYGDYTPLHSAAVNNQVETVQLLLDKGAYVDVRDMYSKTPLLWAAQHHSLEATAKLLLEHGADVNVQSMPRLSTPLHAAVEIDDLKLVKLLVEAGADITLKDRDGETPRQIASADIGKYLDSVAQDTERTEALRRRQIRASFSSIEPGGMAYASDDPVAVQNACANLIAKNRQKAVELMQQQEEHASTSWR